MGNRNANTGWAFYKAYYDVQNEKKIWNGAGFNWTDDRKKSEQVAVSYTHLTLPTKRIV